MARGAISDVEVTRLRKGDNILNFLFQASRKVGDQIISSDDDLFILDMAKQKNGVVISRDNFRDAYYKTTDDGIKEVINSR